jgi:hypothetical protein
MECGKEIPEDGQFCPGCGVSAPRRMASPPAPYPYPYQYPYPYPSPGMPAAPSPQGPSVPPAQGFGQAGPPPAPYAGQAYPGPGYPAHYGYPLTQAPAPMPGYYPSYQGQAPPIVVVPMGNPLPRKPPLGQRIRERQEVYMQQARENRLETGLSIAAAGMVVLGVLAMLATSL